MKNPSFTLAFICLLMVSLAATVASTSGRIQFLINESEEVMRMTENGLGLFNSSPAANLHVNGNALISGSLSVGGVNNSGSNLHVQGAMSLSIESISNSGNISGEHNMVLVDASSADLELRLPDPSIIAGSMFHIKKISSSGNALILPFGQEAIDGGYQLSLIDNNQLAWVTLISTGSEWFILNIDDSSILSTVGATSDLKLWLALEEGSGNSLRDSSTYNNHGKANEISPTWITGPGGSSSALYFDGTDDHAVVNSSSSMEFTGALGMSFWIKRDGLEAGHKRILSKKTSWDGSNGFELEMGGAGTQIIALVGGSDLAAATVGWVPNQWHHVVVNISGTSAQFYFDGSAAIMSDSTIGALAADNTELYLGRDNAGSGRSAFALSDLRIYNKTLTISDIDNLWESLPPAITARTFLVTKGIESYTISSNYLSISDSTTASSNIIFTVTGLPSHGNLLINSVAASLGDRFTQADIDNKLLLYEVNDSVIINDSISFSAFLSPRNYRVNKIDLLVDNSGANLVGFWRMNEGSGSTVSNGSIYNGDMTLGNMDSSDWQAPPSGGSGNALSFDGVDDYGEVTHYSELGVSGDITIATWVKWDSSGGGGGMRLLGKKTAWNAINGYAIEMGPATDEFTFLSNGVTFSRASGVAWTTGWHHIAVTGSGTTATFYFDGEVVTDNSSGYAAITSGTENLFIGSAYGPNDHFEGLIDDLRIYNRALDSTEIKEIAADQP